MRLVFFGSGSFGLPSLETLAASGNQILAVVTNSDKPSGRNLQPAPTPVKKWAMDHKIRVMECADIRDKNLADKLALLGADVFVVIAFGFILPKTILQIPNKTLNVHSSLLPLYRGAAPIHWALLRGDAETGVTVMEVNEKLDQGDILWQKKTPIASGDDLESLEARLSALGAEALAETLHHLEKRTLKPVAQTNQNLFYARKLSKEDGHVSWNLKAAEIERRVRALKNWPGCYFFYKKARFLIHQAAIVAGQSTARPGEILRDSVSGGLAIQAADKAIEIRQIQMEGKKSMPVAEFLKGFQFEAGQIVE